MSPRSVSQAVSLSRRFIAWLADEGVVDRRLTLSATSPCAQSVRVVSVLDESQVRRIAEFRANASTPMELRDAAMVSLGLWEGLRACDVVALRLDAVDWRSSTLSVAQRKTGVRGDLPLMPEAGNSVAGWLLRGRPDDADSPCVFVRLDTPHVGLMSTTACDAALRHALGDAYGDCGGFHELRRTYATEILRGGSGVRAVTEALGHRTDDSARPYLSLDEERMALCAMPLGDAGAPPSRRGGAGDGES
jgi:integrase